MLLLSGCATGMSLPDAGDQDADRTMDAAPTDAGHDSGRDAGPRVDGGPPCPDGRSRCGDDVCRDLWTDVHHCGRCDRDCTTLPNVDATRIRCMTAVCQLPGACLPGFADCNAEDGCESDLTSPATCGNCGTSCTGETPVCSRGSTGTYRCAASCDGTTPDLCDARCTNLLNDPANCGECGMTCTTSIPNARPVCRTGLCDYECESGFRLCGGECVSTSDPMACGPSCLVCPVPLNGSATCVGGTCGIRCDTDYTNCSGSCVNLATSIAHCGMCGRTCDGACIGGVCETGVRILLESGADQTAYVNQELPTAIVVRVEDAAMSPIVGATVTFTAPTGAVVTPAMVTTNTMGRATTLARLGRVPGTYRFEATTPMGAVTVRVDATAVAPPRGTRFPVLNANRTSGNTATEMPATAALVGAPRGVAVAADGTIYVSDATYHRVRAISPTGIVRLVAGAGTAGFLGDGGAATAARLSSPSGLALDASGRFLYIADTGNHAVRLVDLTTGIISTFAGRGTATTAPFGDGGPATAATFSSPGHVRIGPDGDVYVSDNARARIRRIDAVSGIITTFVPQTLTTACANTTLGISSCADGRNCDIAWDATGRAFVSGTMCGTDIGTATGAIARVEADGTLRRVAGVAGGTTADGAPGTSALVNGAGSLTFDPAGNLYYVEYTSHRVRRLDGTTGAVTTVTGIGTSGPGSDFILAEGQAVATPWDLAFDAARTLYLSEAGGFSVRAIWGIGEATSPSVNLALFGGGTQTTSVDREVPMPFAARLTDSVGSPLVGLPVTFTAIDPGAGVVATSALTTSMGVAAVFGRPGLAPGPYRLEARFDDLHGVPVAGSPVTFTVTATEPLDGTIFTAVNVARATTGAIGPEGAATYARIGTPGGLAVASDGSVLIADRGQHVVWHLSPRGVLTRFAGTGVAGFLGDAGPARDARLNAPTGLALDETNGVLYVADRGNHRVRSIDLSTHVIRTFAGGGTATTSPYGDGGPATSATLSNPGNVAVDPSGTVYVTDTGRNRIRQVDPATGIIAAWLGGEDTCTTVPVRLADCATSQYATCHVLFDGSGDAYVSGRICGNAAPLSSTVVYGVVRRAPDGTLTHVAGRPSGMTSDGIDPTQASIGIAGWLARGPDGALHYGDLGQHRIRRIDPTSNLVFTIAGSGSAGFAGEYVPASAAVLNQPWGLAFANGHLFLADGASSVVRVIW